MNLRPPWAVLRQPPGAGAESGRAIVRGAAFAVKSKAPPRPSCRPAGVDYGEAA